MQEITSGASIRDLRAGAYPGGSGPPRLSGLSGHTRTADGVLLVPSNLEAIDAAARERWTQHLEIREDGGIRYYDSRVGERGSGPQAALLGLDLVLVLTTFREILVLALELSRSYGFAGVWHLGVAVTGINGARMIISGQGGRVVFRTHGRDSYTRDS